MEGDITMNIFSFASLIILSGLAVYSLVVSVLTFCGNKRVITEKVQRRYHVKTYRLYSGFLHLGDSLFTAAAAYFSFIDVSWSMIIILIIILIIMTYGIAGSIYLLKNKHLIKDSGVVIDIDDMNEMTDDQIKARGSLMLGYYMLLPVLILIGALLLY